VYIAIKIYWYQSETVLTAGLLFNQEISKMGRKLSNNYSSTWWDQKYNSLIFGGVWLEEQAEQTGAIWFFELLGSLAMSRAIPWTRICPLDSELPGSEKTVEPSHLPFFRSFRLCSITLFSMPRPDSTCLEL
jgi:hypothetical protein